ncbi:unnamed protein product [Larinioides sclopetarius]|uniref:C2H2-type domain-containing protein n=1 Tax=Larinioides sclopetarius TaxID=280406 RepID=A0AAV1ZCZ3_9ARAC
MPIFSEDDIIQITRSKPPNINADLYAQALAAKSSLGLLDVGKCSALEALRSYDSHIDSPVTSPEKKQNFNPHSSQLSRSSFQQTPGHHSSFYNDIEEEEDDLSPYKYTSTSQNSNPDHPVAFKPITDLNLNSVDDEDEFLYGDSNPLPSENSSFQNETSHKKRFNDAYNNDNLLDVETIGFDKYPKSLPFSKSKELNDDGKSGIKLSISSFKKRSWNYSNDPVADNRSAKQESSLTSKQYKESFDAYSNSPSALNEGNYEQHSYLHYNLDNQSRSSIPFKSSKESSLKFSQLDSLKKSDSSLNQSISVEDNSKNYEAAANLLRKQLNLNISSKNNTPYEEEFYSKYNELPQNERRVIYDDEKKAVDKSSSGEPLKFPKLLINVQQVDSSPSKRVVQMKESSISSSKYNASLTKSESSLIPTHNKNEDLELDKNVYEPDDLGTRRVVRDKTKMSREPVKVSSKGETRVLPKRYTEKSHKKNDEPNIKQRSTEKLPKKYSDKYHYVKEGMESYYGSKSKSHKGRSPERHWSPSYSPRRRSPSYSPRQWSPEYHRRRSPSYSPPNSHSRNRSPSYRYHDPSPSYRSHYTRRRSSERASRRDRHSHERSPRRHSRYRSRDRSPSWSVAEKESEFSHDSNSVANPESKKKERTVMKRGRNLISEEKSDGEQECSVSEPSVKLKDKEPSKILEASESINSDVIFSKKRKLAIPDENKEDTFQKSQHPNAVTKLMHGLGITKSTSDPFTQNKKGTEIAQDLPDSKEKRAEVMNSLLNKLGISSSTSSITTTIAPATSWTVGSTDSQTSVSAAPQQLNVNQYGMHYPQQLTTSVPQMYPQQYVYRSSVPPISHFPPFNTPPPMYPHPIPSTSAFSYPPPVPNNFSSVNIQINPRATNPNSKGRISCLKSIPVVNSNQSMPQPSVVWNQNNPSSPTNLKTPDSSNTLVKGVMPKNLSAVSPEATDSSIETEQTTVEKYKKLLEEKETLQKKLKNTSDHIIEIRNLQAELEKMVKLPKTSATKQLNIKCSNLFDKTNEELKRYIDEAKRVSGHLKELQTKIKPETLEKIAKEVSEKKVSSSVKYAGYDAGSHWCESCNQHISTIPKMMEHLHSETHIKHVDPSKVITKEPPKESFDKNVRLWPAKGVEFMKPLYAFYCSLCDEMLSNQSYAEYHLKGNSHIEKYMTFLNENPVYERKRDIFKEAAIVALANEKKQKDLEEIRLAKQLFKEKIEIKRQKKQDAIKTISDKLQQLKEKDKVSEELEESNFNARMSPQNQKTGLKLTLINEKNKVSESLEPTVTKGPEVKPKPKVVYIGRAPNYKPRTKGTEKKSSTPSESKNTDSYVKDEEWKNPNAISKVEQTASDFTTLFTDEKIKNSKKLAVSIQSHSKSKIESPKKVKNIPGCQSEAEAKESERVACDSDKRSVQSSEMPTDNSEINEAIKNFIRSRKNATPTKVDDNLSSMKTPELLTKTLELPSPVSTSSPKKSSPFSESSPKVLSPISKSSPKVTSTLMSSSLVSSPVVSSSLVSSPVVSSSLVSSPIVSSSLVSSPLRRKQPLSEEEKDFLILGISKSDMEPLAVPRPPPSNLIHNHSDTVSNFQQFPPPLQIPPPDIISKVPPPNIISQVPPPNITSQVPPPNITSQVPPPTLVLQWSSEQNQQSTSVLSNVPFSNNDIPFMSKQFLFTSTINENTGVMDMEIDNDLVYSEIKVGSDVPSTEKKLSVLGEPVINELTISSLSAGELCAKGSVQQVSNSDIFTKEDDNRLLLKKFLNSLMDSVSEKVAEDLKNEKNSIKSISENSLLSSNKTTGSNEKSSDHKFNLNPSSFDPQSVSFPQSESNEKYSSVEKEKNMLRCIQLDTVSSKIPTQYNDDEKIFINDPFNKDVSQNISKVNNSKSSQEMEIEEILVNKEENLSLTSTSKKIEEFYNIKEVGKCVANSCQSTETETCEFLEQKINVSISSKDRTSVKVNKEIDENESNSLSLYANKSENNADVDLSSSKIMSIYDVTITSEISAPDDANSKNKYINDPFIKDVNQNISEENYSKNSQEIEMEKISVNKEEKNLISTSRTTEEFNDVKELEKPVTSSYHSIETETFSYLEQKNNVSLSSEGETSVINNENETNSFSLNVNQTVSNANSVMNLSISNTTSSCDVTISSEIAGQYGADEKMSVNDPLIKNVIENSSEENNSKSSQEIQRDKIRVNNEEKNLNFPLISKTIEEFNDVKKEVEKPVADICLSVETENLEQKNKVPTSFEVGASIGDKENERNLLPLNANQRNSNLNSVINLSSSKIIPSYDVTVSSEITDTDEKLRINDPLINDVIQNVSEENNSKYSQEMVEEISVNKEEKNLNLTSTLKTVKEFHDIKEMEKSVSSSYHSIETETCEFLERKNNVSTSFEVGVSISDNDNERSSLSLNANPRESNVIPVMNSSSSNIVTSYDEYVSERKEKMELTKDQIVTKRSPVSSSIIKIEVKEEINEPVESFQLENLSNKLSADIKREIDTETVDDVLSKSSTLTGVSKYDQNFPVKSAESSQVQISNDFASENVSNVKEDKEAIPSEDYNKNFKKYDSEDILNKISTDEKSFLNEPEESANKPLSEELKGELNSDTDEYETAEN